MIIECLEYARLSSKDFYRLDNYVLRLKHQAVKKLLAALQIKFNLTTGYRGKFYCWDTVMRLKCQELASYILSRRSELDFHNQRPVLPRDDSEAVRNRILSMSCAEAEQLGIRKNTLWYIQKEAAMYIRLKQRSKSAKVILMQCMVVKDVADRQLHIERFGPLLILKETVVHYGVVSVSAFIKLKNHRLEVARYFAMNTTVWFLNFVLPLLGLQKLSRCRLLKMSREPWLTMTAEGLLFYVRPFQSDISIQSNYFEHRLRFYFEGIQSGTFVDVGAHIGKYTVLVAKKLGSKGRVIAIEPERENFIMLKKNVEANQLENVLSLNVACFSKDTQTRLYVSDESGCHSLKRIGPHYQLVPARRLDSLVQELELHEITAIKIDVEDTELNVLRGAELTLFESHPQVLFESRNRISLEQCAAFLSKFGYRIRQVDHHNYLAT